MTQQTPNTVNTSPHTTITESKDATVERWLEPTTTTPLSPAEDLRETPSVSPALVQSTADQPAGLANVARVAVSALQPNPLNTAIYGEEEVDDELVASIRRLGVLNPLHATADHVVIDGHRRLKAAASLGSISVPVLITEVNADPLVAEEHLLESNRTRSKNNEQRIREFMAYKRIESERAKVRMLQGKEPLLKSTGGDTAETGGNARDIAAKKVNMGWAKAVHGEAVVLAIDTLEAKKEAEAAGQLRKLLNEKSIEAAHRTAVQQGWIKDATQRKPQAKQNISRAPDAPAAYPADEPDLTLTDDRAISAPAESIQVPGNEDGGESLDVSTGLLHTMLRDQPIVELADSQSVQVGEGQCEVPPTSHEQPSVPPNSDSPGIEIVAATNPAIVSISSSQVASSTHDDDQKQGPVAMEHMVDQPVASNLVPNDKVSQANGAISMRDFPGCDDHDIVPCARYLIEPVAALLDKVAGKFPDMEGRDLARALGMANNKIQVAMKWF